MGGGGGGGGRERDEEERSEIGDLPDGPTQVLVAPTGPKWGP